MAPCWRMHVVHLRMGSDLPPPTGPSLSQIVHPLPPLHQSTPTPSQQGAPIPSQTPQHTLHSNPPPPTPCPPSKPSRRLRRQPEALQAVLRGRAALAERAALRPRRGLHDRGQRLAYRHGACAAEGRVPAPRRVQEHQGRLLHGEAPGACLCLGEGCGWGGVSGNTRVAFCMGSRGGAGLVRAGRKDGGS